MVHFRPVLHNERANKSAESGGAKVCLGIEPRHGRERHTLAHQKGAMWAFTERRVQDD